jgi:hypothetical protein
VQFDDGAERSGVVFDPDDSDLAIAELVPVRLEDIQDQSKLLLHILK